MEAGLEVNKRQMALYKYLAGVSLRDISRELDVPIDVLLEWKEKDDWEGKREEFEIMVKDEIDRQMGKLLEKRVKVIESIANTEYTALKNVVEMQQLIDDTILMMRNGEVDRKLISSLKDLQEVVERQVKLIKELMAGYVNDIDEVETVVVEIKAGGETEKK